MEGAVSVRRKAFAAAHRIDEDRQVYISAFRHASSVIAKSKTEAWQATYLSLSSKSVYSILRSVTVFSSSSSSLNFPNCSPEELASVFANLRSDFSVS